MLTRPFGSMIYSKRPRKITVACYPPFPTITHLLGILTGPRKVSRYFDPSDEKKSSRARDSKTGFVGKRGRRDKASEEAVSRVLCTATEHVAAGRPFLYGGRFHPP